MLSRLSPSCGRSRCLQGQGKNIAAACKETGTTEQTFLSMAQGVRRSQRRSGQATEAARGRERPAEEACGRSVAGEAGAARYRPGKIVSPERRRQAVCDGSARYGLSERQACRIVGQPRGTQRYIPARKPDEDELTHHIIDLASEYGRYGYRRVTALLNESGIEVGKDRVQRIWRREGLKVPQKQPKRSRLWLTDGSCVRLRPRASKPRLELRLRRMPRPTTADDCG